MKDRRGRIRKSLEEITPSRETAALEGSASPAVIADRILHTLVKQTVSYSSLGAS